MDSGEGETVSPSHKSSATNPSVMRGGRFTVGGLLGVRYAPIATKFYIAAKCRDGPVQQKTLFDHLGVAGECL